jgi:hypothetical protein
MGSERGPGARARSMRARAWESGRRGASARVVGNKREGMISEGAGGGTASEREGTVSKGEGVGGGTGSERGRERARGHG